MNDYRATSGADRCGTHLVGHTRPITYAALVDAVGFPLLTSDDGDGKVSTEWVFSGPDGVFTLYDYKETSLYSAELPSVAAFRAGDAYEWHIGGRTNPGAFLDWLEARLNGGK